MRDTSPTGRTRFDAFIDRINARPGWLRQGAAIALGLILGALLDRTGLPIGWLVGALLATGACGAAGLRIAIPDILRRAGQLAVGVSVGLSFSPAVAREVMSLGWVMFLCSAGSIAASVLISRVLSRVGGCDPGSAFFASMPGGMAEMAGFADRFAIDAQLVSLAQTLRVVSLVLILPPLLTFASDATGAALPHPVLGWGATVACLAAATLAGLGLQRMNMFNPWLLGGLGVGIAMGLSHSDAYQAPHLLRVAAQIGIGLALGARFRRSLFAALTPRLLATMLCCTGLLILTGVGLALVMSRLVSFPEAALAVAPGGMAEMSLTAEVLGLQAQVVTASHIVRILVVALSVGPLFRLYARAARLDVAERRSGG